LVISLEKFLERDLAVQRELEKPKSKWESKELAVKRSLTSNLLRVYEIESACKPLFQ